MSLPSVVGSEDTTWVETMNSKVQRIVYGNAQRLISLDEHPHLMLPWDTRGGWVKGMWKFSAPS